MTTSPQIPKRFRASFSSLHSDAQYLLAALNDPAVADPVLARLPSTLLANFTAQVALVAALSVRKTDAVGTVATLTQAEGRALAEFKDLAAVARRAARLAFQGNDTLLHGAFQVGGDASRSVATILDRGRSLVAACESHPEELAVFGWPATDTPRLSALLHTLSQAGVDQSTAADVKQGATAERVHAANTLYVQCLAIQTAARAVYSKPKIARDPSLLEGRARFLLDEFPRRRRRPRAATAVGSPSTASASTSDATRPAPSDRSTEPPAFEIPPTVQDESLTPGTPQPNTFRRFFFRIGDGLRGGRATWRGERTTYRTVPTLSLETSEIPRIPERH